MGIGFHAFVILAAPVAGLLVWLMAQVIGLPMPIAIILGAGVGALIILSLRIASQWQVAVVMRFGKFHKLSGPGLFILIPIVDSVSYWIDLRTVASPFRAEQTLTGDSVPVDVDEVMFWRVVDPQKAALEVKDYVEAISWAAQTALRDVIGSTDLAAMMVGRREIGPKLQKLISEKAGDWGIEVISVELRDVRIPADLQNAMSKQAQAERE
ncbi:MAG: slipin family protein, partial [Gammaproteobacteria bacterium]|nr:slipin family protein [Gammaproteobacteria bacterium]